MSLFGAISISGTGVQAMQTWIDTDAGNVANADDEVAVGSTPYQEQVASFSPSTATNDGVGDGVTVAVDSDTSAGQVVEDPGSSVANSSGEVTVPNISLGDQLVGLIQAQEGYQGDTSAMSRAISAYQAGLTIGS